ncbi:MAG TPA: TolC family protein, partial [Phycisphaerales bacterium]|nr:TolC family protein [Phycisphaerales bacterium]
VPLGNEAAESRVHQAILRRLQRFASKDAQRQAIEQEVFNALDNLEATWQRILAARQSVILAARTLAGEQRQFDVGSRTSTDVLDAAARLADAQSNEIRALAGYQAAQVDLAFATGTLLGAAKVEWEPYDPRGPQDQFGDTIWDHPHPGIHDPNEIPRRLPVPETMPEEPPGEATVPADMVPGASEPAVEPAPSSESAPSEQPR